MITQCPLRLTQQPPPLLPYLDQNNSLPLLPAVLLSVCMDLSPPPTQVKWYESRLGPIRERQAQQQQLRAELALSLAACQGRDRELRGQIQQVGLARYSRWAEPVHDDIRHDEGRGGYPCMWRDERRGGGTIACGVMRGVFGVSAFTTHSEPLPT